MNPIQHVRVKVFASRAVSIDDAIPVFHRWIQERVHPEMLIDVADYRHVPDGPGVMAMRELISALRDADPGTMHA